jgi:hypothetical protein
MALSTASRRKQITSSQTGEPDVSFALETLAALYAAAEYDAAWVFYQALPPAMQVLGTVQLAAAKVALERDDLAFVETAFQAEFCSIHEGAADLTNLWFGYQAKLLVARSGLSLAEALVEVRCSCPPPYPIDFRVMEWKSGRLSPRIPAVTEFVP